MVNGSWDDGDDDIRHEWNTSWNDGDCEIGNQSDAAHGGGDGDVHDFGTLVSRPRRKVEKTDVQYDKKPKHVDVDALKKILWSIMQELQKSGEEVLSFKKILTSFLTGTLSAGDISPHLCFICILHLANKHQLTIHESPDLQDLSIHF
ncbi:hypothetical protein L2E82_00003 [Cichorium intybus]|uniref:Uncharacterized protein n=1 Tax=Cichorium intybus TaxID=13427 RepID=A0ACB9GY95_CICIN|nr:hypothetical protein L2E82_00003 [Cichorium intybus]